MQGERRILHLDMDAYFASLEAQACPPLKGRPLVVGALPGSRGVVASASYEARAYGIRAGMPAAQARRLCPQAEFVPCHPALYIDTSRRLLRHLLGFTDQVEMYSIDEAFLDITRLTVAGRGEEASWARAEALAREIAGSVEQAFGLTCSVGVGPNKLIAKMASKLQKPRGITLLGKETFRGRFWHRPVDDLFGVGEKTSSSLMIFGIETIGELAHTPAEFLRSRFGVFGEALMAMAWGEDETPLVAAHASPAAKSMGHEHTVAADLRSLDEGLSLLLALSERVAGQLRSEGYEGRRVAIKLRFSDFSTISRQRVLTFLTQETRDVYRTAKDLFVSHYCGDGLRLLGLTMGELRATDGGRQIGLFPEDRRYTRYLEAVDRIRSEYGEESLLPAGALRARAARPEARGQRGEPSWNRARRDRAGVEAP